EALPERDVPDVADDELLGPLRRPPVDGAEALALGGADRARDLRREEDRRDDEARQAEGVARGRDLARLLRRAAVDRAAAVVRRALAPALGVVEGAAALARADDGAVAPDLVAAERADERLAEPAPRRLALEGVERERGRERRDGRDDERRE